ncbi:unnamed protein product [marine sediment metagenome]|uniref:Uncharacterized protein n=1 Tax=marine sediment metagenome TaxID=412755 RepID=X1BB29_9ZZZZ
MSSKQQFPFECRFCALLKEVEDPLPGEEGYYHYRCSVGRFDAPTPSGTVPQSFAWSGIWRPNKKVAVAEKGCPHFKLHPLVLLVGKSGRP